MKLGLYILLVICCCSCKNSSTPPVASLKDSSATAESERAAKTASYKKPQSQTLSLYGTPVDLKVPDSVKGCIVILPGWSFPRYDWCNKSTLCSQALQKGFALIMPEMGESIYATRFYPESWDKMRVTLTRRWVTDTLIKFLQDSLGIVKPGQNNFIMGLSTGAHGSGLVVEDNPTLFKGCALLSGDYDQTRLPQDMVFIATYGRFQQFPERWKTDNVLTGIAQLNIPIYIGHGIQDPIIPIDQSKYLESTLRKIHRKQIVESHYINGVHDYKYWEQESTPILTFFSKLMN